MTVSTTVNREDDIGNDAVDTYSGAFRIFADTDVVVYVEDLAGLITKLTLTTDYTVTGLGLYSGFSIVLVNAAQAWLTAGGKLKNGYKIALRRKLPLTQLTDLRNRGGFFPEDHETVFDRLAMIAQQHQDEINRSIKFPETDGLGLTTELPSAAVRALKYQAFDALGNVIASSGGPGTVPIAAYWEGVLDETNLANSLTAMGVASDMRAFLATANDAAARTELGATAVGDSLFVAASAAAARAAITAAASGANADITSLTNLSGGQIKFPAAQVASADANTLDDYEEGTWTPSVGGSATYSSRSGSYIKIGKLVYLEIYLFINAIGTGSQNTITGVPFDTTSNSGGGMAARAFNALASSVSALTARIIPSQSIELRGVSAGGGTSSDTVTNILGNSALFAGSGCYIATN